MECPRMSAIPLPFLACVLLLLGQNVPVGAGPQAPSIPESKSIESTVACGEMSYAREVPQRGHTCEEELLAKRGRPHMFLARNGFAFGVSSNPQKPTALYLWANNQTEKAVMLLVCCGSTLFEHINIFDSSGHRVPSKLDQSEEKARSDGKQFVRTCTCSGSVSVPPHSIELIDFYDDISIWYSLPPGRYTISERNPPAPYILKEDENGTAPEGLRISIP
jgi:hypothetical protein